MPLVAVREWLTGVRPVAGALGACGLMLLACSWFAFNPGGIDVGQNADAPTAVRINDALNESVGESHALRGSASATSTRPAVSRPAHSRHAPATATSTRTATKGGPRSTDASPVPATQSSHGSAQAATQSSPATSPLDDPGVTITTPTLPAPLDGVPTVTTPTVPVPQVPSLPVPDLPTITTKLGLP